MRSHPRHPVSSSASLLRPVVRLGAWLVVLLLGVTAGCDDAPHRRDADNDLAIDTTDAQPTDADTAEDQVGAPTTSTDLLADYCRPWAEWTCARVLACACSTPSGEGPTQVGCEALAMDECQSLTAELQAVADAGELVVAVDEVAACQRALEVAAGPCGEASESAAGPSCARQFAQPAALGQACDGPPCAGGAGACRDGTCVPLSGPNEPCTHRVHCVSGDCVGGRCEPLVSAPGACGDGLPACGGGASCLDGTCITPAAAGEACTADAGCIAPLTCRGGACVSFPDAECMIGSPCGHGGMCLGTVDARCAPLGDVGAPCVGDTGCTSGTACVGGLCVAAPGLDAPCADGVVCAEGLGCRPEGAQAGTCGALPGKGEPCALGPMGPFLCAPGLACLADLFVCDDPPLAGEPCANPNLCAQDDLDGDGIAPDLGCDFTETGSVCTLRKQPGEPCQNDQVCGVGLYCDYRAGACAPAQSLGTSCSVGNECGAEAVCLPDVTGDLSCAPLPGIGERCMFDCQAGGWCHAQASEVRCQPAVCQLMYQLH